MRAGSKQKGGPFSTEERAQDASKLKVTGLAWGVIPCAKDPCILAPFHFSHHMDTTASEGSV